MLPGISDWAAEWMFGDGGTAVAQAEPWAGGAAVKPRTPEEKRLSRLKRGGPEVSRGARILEGDDMSDTAREQLGYARPVPQLAPKASAEFDSAAVDIPRGAKNLHLSFIGPTGS